MLPSLSDMLHEPSYGWMRHLRSTDSMHSGVVEPATQVGVYKT